MSYTPGPWKIGAFDQYGGYDMMTSGVSAGPACLDGASYGQKRCIDMEPDAKDRMMSDASLISAAPDLLEALERMTAQFRKIEPYMNDPGTVVFHACAAIAKARGQ